MNTILKCLCRRHTRVLVAVLFIHFSLFNKPEVVADNEAGGVAVVDKNAGSTKPTLQIIQRHWDVLGVSAVKDPDLAAGCRARHAVAVVMKQYAIIFGIAAQTGAKAFGVLNVGIKTNLILCATTELLVLYFELGADLVDRLLRVGVAGGVDPGLEFGAGLGLHDIWRIDTDIEAENYGCVTGALAVLHAPIKRGKLFIRIGVAGRFMTFVFEIIVKTLGMVSISKQQYQ